MNRSNGKTIENIKKLRRAALVTVLLALMLSWMSTPAFLAYDCTVYADEKGSEEASEAADGGAMLPETGEPVKCKTGTLIAPVGDPNAEAPEIKARGAALYSIDMDRIIYGKNENDRMEPYSTTKLLTCWLALENLGPDEMVTVSEKAAQPLENGTTIWLKTGEKISVRDLVYGAMLESGNDAAHALGEAVSGSEADFAELMNKTAEEWGCKDTHFVNANGWKNAEHYSTAYDMAVITARCLENKELAEIAMAKSYTAAATNLSGERELKNYFLHVTGKIDALTGGKTGTWDDDDCAIVASFSEGGLSEVVVLLGDTEKGRPEDLHKLIEFSHSVTPGFAVPASGAVIETARVRHGEKTKLDLISDGTTYAYPKENKEKEITTEISYDKLEAPVNKGDAVGTLTVYANDKLIGEHKLIASEDIAVGWLPSYIYISNQMTLNILKVLGALVLLILLLRIINKSRSKRRKRKRGAAPSGSKAEKAAPESRPASEKGSGKISAKEKREARRRLREKYRGKH